MTTGHPAPARAVAERRPAPRARVGVFGIGLDAYWPQFAGLKARIEGYQRRVEERIGELGGEVVSAGLVDTAQGAREAGDRFASARVDLVLCHAVTYATSSTVLPVAQAAKVPVVLLGLQPTATLDYAEHGHGGVAGQLRRLLRAGDRRRVHARRHPVRHGRRHDRRRRAGVGEDRRLGARRGRGARPAALPDRLPRARLSGHARHVRGLHGAPRPGRRARGGARDRRPGRARGRGERRGGGRPRRRRSGHPSPSRTRRRTRSPGRSRPSSSTGRPAWRSASTGWSRTSGSTP